MLDRRVVAVLAMVASPACGANNRSASSPLENGAGAGGSSAIGAGGTTDLGCSGLRTLDEPSEKVYVAANGDDSAAGTDAAPLRTLGEAARRMPEGGTVVVRGGTYPPQPAFPAMGTSTRPLVIRAATGEKPVFDGTAVTESWSCVIRMSQAEHVVLSGLEVKNCLADSCNGICSTKPILDLTLRELHIHHISGPAARFSGKTLRFEGNNFHDLALANQDNVNYPGGGWPTCMGTAPDWGVVSEKPWVDGVVIRNNRIVDCWGEGIGLWYAANAVVEGNTVVNAWNVGIYLDNTYNVRVERNYVRMNRGINANRGTGILMGSEPYEYWPSNANHHITIANNVIVAGSGVGWWNATSYAYGPLLIEHNTIVAAMALEFAETAPGLMPAASVARNNVFAEERNSWLGNAGAWNLRGNAWLNRPKPPVAGGSDVSLTVASVPAPSFGTDAQPLAALVGTGEAGTELSHDFLCAVRSPSAPTRGAFEQ